MSDDELIDIPKKIPKLDVNESINESETCNICLEAWTTSGDHKIVSIKCGHVFGQKCIESWLQKSGNKAYCPMCKRSFNKNDIRPIFLNVKTVAMENNNELIKTISELSKTEKKLREMHDECSKLKLMNQLMTSEMLKLQEENKRLLEMKDLVEYQKEANSLSGNSSNKSAFQLIQKLQISAIGNCRVMDYSHLDDNICVSCPSSVRLVTGYGVRVIDIHQLRMKKYIPLHSSMIRNVEFSPFCSTNLMLSCSLDKYVKISSTNSNSIVGSFMCSNPVWSCTWSNNNNIVYAGLANGVIEEIDSRNLSSAVSTINTQSGGPIVSMRYVCGNDYLKDNGLIVTNFKGVTFHHNSLSATQEYSSLINCKTDTLLISSHYNSSLIHTAFNHKTYHMLNTFRPSNTSKNVKYLFSAIGSNTDDSDLMYASDIKSLDGATSAQFMSRSCFLTSSDKDSANFAVAANEESCSVKVWDLNNNYASQVLFPKEVTPQKPIIDLCQYSSDPLAFAALNSDNLYLFRQK